jgi:hypothetical protein
MLCGPAYPSGFSADHSLPSADQYRVPILRSRSTISVNHAAGTNLVADGSHQCEFDAIVDHFINSAHVTDRSWFSLLALTITLEPILVDSIHRMIHPTSALFPMPRPEAIASLMALKSTLPWFDATCRPICTSTFCCHSRGPVKCSSGVPCTPQGNTDMTKINGLLQYRGDVICSSSSCSCCGVDTSDLAIRVHPHRQGQWVVCHTDCPS